GRGVLAETAEGGGGLRALEEAAEDGAAAGDQGAPGDGLADRAGVGVDAGLGGEVAAGEVFFEGAVDEGVQERGSEHARTLPCETEKSCAHDGRGRAPTGPD